MDIKLAINASDNLKIPELEMVSGKEGLLFLSEKLKSYTSELNLHLAIEDNRFYPKSIKKLTCRQISFSNGLLNLLWQDELFTIEGDELAVSNFAETLKNLAESETDYHFHIDYYEDNGIVSETNISLVLALKINFDIDN